MSLLEALVVISILGLIGALAFPRIEQAYQVATLRQSGNRLIQDIRIARAEAVRSGRPTGISVSHDGLSYVMPDGQPRLLPNGIRLTLDGGGVSFFSDGEGVGGKYALTSVTTGHVLAGDTLATVGAIRSQTP